MPNKIKVWVFVVDRSLQRHPFANSLGVGKSSRLGSPTVFFRAWVRVGSVFGPTDHESVAQPRVCTCLAPVIRPEGPAPKGQESLAQGLPWVSGNKRFALKGPPAFRDMFLEASLAGAPSGPPALNQKPRVNPGLSSSAPSGQVPSGLGKHAPNKPSSLVVRWVLLSLKCPNCDAPRRGARLNVLTGRKQVQW